MHLVSLLEDGWRINATTNMSLLNNISQHLTENDQPNEEEYQSFFEGLVRSANRVAAGYDNSIELVSVDNNKAKATMTDDDEETSEELVFLVEVIGEAHDTAILRVTDPDGLSHIVGASGVNLFRCLYI